jgi:23S rRNA (adenine-N6)-dimethyltransferase
MRTHAPSSNPAGIHLLRSSKVIQQLIESAELGPHSLVLDLGAGPGTLTAPLADTGARVLAIERNPEFVRRLEKRFADRTNVRVIHQDLRHVSLPHRPFQVVASIPYALSTYLFRRLLSPRKSPLTRADLVVEWGFARRLTGPHPRDLDTAWWAARYDLRIQRRVPAKLFVPAPRVDSAHVTVRARPGSGNGRTLQALWGLLATTYASDGPLLRSVLADLTTGKRAHRLARGLPASAADLTPDQWAALARAVAAEDVPLPRLPAQLHRR